MGICLIRIGRSTGCLQNNQAQLRELLARMAIAGARNLVRKVGQAANAELFAQLVAKIANRFARNAAPTTNDPTTRKLRSLQ